MTEGENVASFKESDACKHPFFLLCWKAERGLTDEKSGREGRKEVGRCIIIIVAIFPSIMVQFFIDEKSFTQVMRVELQTQKHQDTGDKQLFFLFFQKSIVDLSIRSLELRTYLLYLLETWEVPFS